MRAVFGLFLAVMLSVTSVTAAAARGQMAGATEMVLCAGTDVAKVMLDATGKPVQPHHCPVCTAATDAALEGRAGAVLRPQGRAVALGPGAAAVPRVAGLIVPVARGPPRLA